ncbi:MAG: DM13 domain-containing protein [Hyphomicrobiaceae bacterium]
MFRKLLAATAVVMMVAAPVTAAIAADTVKSGSFRNAGGHKTSGSVSLVKDGDTYKVVLGSNFRHDGAPDPKVAFGNGKYVKGTIIGKLKKNNGASSYTVPKSLKVTQFTQIWIWCEKYNVPLGVASIQ